jgi:hypothetical protein
MKKRILIPIGLLVVLLSFSFSKQRTSKAAEMKSKSDTLDTIVDLGYIPKQGFVPDSITAIKIADVILSQYGNFDFAKPFNAHLSKDGKYWSITNRKYPPHTYGGGVDMEIEKSDCKILFLELTK